jgi:uncharacterized FlaG/YvyC family protein
MAKIEDRVRVVDAMGQDMPRRQQGQADQQPPPDPGRAKLVRALEALKAAAARTMANLEFVLDEDHEAIVVWVIKATGKKRLRSIPADEAERLAQAMTDNHNLLDRWG